MNIGSLDIANLGPAYQHGVLQLVGLDGQQHDFSCGFVQERGILPCTCRDLHTKGSYWWRTWRRWSMVRVNPGWWARHREEPRWPVQVSPNGGWIEGWDF